MKILLIEPHTPETFWSLRHALRFVGRRAANPPLGLVTVAGMLPKKWPSRVVDLNCSSLSDKDIRWADWVFVSGMEIHRESVADIVRRCHALNKKVVGGGPLFSSNPEDNEQVDHVVVGEAEEQAAGLIADLSAGQPAALYEASSYPDLSLTPIPRWDLLDLSRYATLSVQSCRGCPFDCEFCDVVGLNGRIPRYKSPEQFVAELETLRTLGWEGPVFVVDDNFIGDRRRCLKLLHAIIEWRDQTGTRMIFITEASVNMAAHPDLLELMVRAGFKKVFLGLETPNAESLRECRKVQNLRENLTDSVHTIQAAGMEVMGGFIVGFDSDEEDIFQRQFDFIQKAGVVTAMVGLLQALPRSRLYQRLSSEGRLLGSSDGGNSTAAFMFETRLDKEFLETNYRKLMKRLYEPDNYYRRILTFLESHRMTGPRERLTWRDLRAVVQSFWVMGIVSKRRVSYWRFLATALRHHPGQIGVAYTMVILGHHYRRVAAGL